MIGRCDHSWAPPLVCNVIEQPATVRCGRRPALHMLLACSCRLFVCPDHVDQALEVLASKVRGRHRVGSDCGMPGERWCERCNSCHVVADDEALIEALFEMEQRHFEPEVVPATASVRGSV